MSDEFGGIQVHRAQRKKSRARVFVVGASGSGKTFSSIQMAKGLGKKIVIIDTEFGSGELYDHLCEYDAHTIEAPYAPVKLVNAIKGLEKMGYDVIIIDSISKFWNGTGGILEIQQAEERRSGQGWQAWAKVTPLQEQIVDAILESKCHIIATARAKTHWLVDTSGDKMTITKVGTAPIQRKELEYEFTVGFTIDGQHIAAVSKDRTGIFDGQIFQISEKTGKILNDWLNSGREYLPEKVETMLPAPEAGEVVIAAGVDTDDICDGPKEEDW